MLKKTSYVLIIALFSFSSAANAVPLASPISDTADVVVIADVPTTPQPPRAQRKPKRLEKFGDLRVDNYYWLNERSNPEVIDYLKAENDYTQVVTAPTLALRATLFEEIKGRIPQTDQSVPYRADNYFYYDRVEESKQYPIFARKHGDLDAPEQILLDVNDLAKGYEYFEVGDWEVSSGENLLAYAADTTGRRIYTIRFKDLNTDEILKDEITAATDNIVWAEDNQTLFYAMQDAETLRPDRIYRHKVGTPSSEDVLVYEEEDEQFYAYVSKTKSKAYVIVGVSQTLSDELHYLPADKPQSDLQLFQARERGHEYSIEHYGDSFYILTNSGRAENFRLMQTPVDATDKSNWTELIPHRKEVLLEDFEIFSDHLVLEERINGLIQLRIRPWAQPESEYQIDFGEPAYSAGIDINPSFDSSTLRYHYTSMTTPHSVLDFDMTSRKARLLKRQQIGAGFDPKDYRTERLFAPAQDGTQIPVSVVYKKGAKLDGSRPLLLYGYGAYGNSLDAGFSSARLSLLDRGFIYAIAHVRGGEELGRSWYEQGKLLDKQNSFTDFIAFGEFLISEGYAYP